MLQEDPNCLIQRVLQAQISQPSKNDFVPTVESIFEELEIYLSYEDIKNMSKESLHKFVKEKIEEKALHFLNQKKMKHSKVLQIKHEALKMQEYLMPENVKSLEIAKFLFCARTRMLDLGSNFPNKYGKNPQCKLGCDEADSQKHLMECPHLVEDDLVLASDEVSYQDLFSSQVEQQLRIAAILKAKLNLRKEMIK